MKPEPASAHAAPLRQRIALGHTDWLYHHLAVTGPADRVAAFRHAASGAGVIPWRLDLDRMAEDWFHLLVASGGGPRTLSLAGARILVSELREAVAPRHALATARVGRSTVCPFDLHELVPVPAEMLRLGPDDPDALQWLWAHWGTTQALRHVALRPGADRGEALRVSFWAADWTPWRALDCVRAAWPGLRVDVRPIYDLA